jgi:hypothetical protein
MARRGTVHGVKQQRWRELLKRFDAGGLTVRAFCRMYGISEPSFYWWRRELRRQRRQPSPTPAFVPVRVVAEAGDGVVDPKAAGGGIDVLLAGGRRVRVTPGFDAATLARVVAVLEGGG